MQIQEWLNSGADYDTGLILYSKHTKHNKNLLRLFMRKNSYINHEKLKYELSKLKNSHIKNVTIFKGVDIPTNKSENHPPVNVTGNTDNNQYRLLRLNELPVKLHPLYIAQKNDFYKSCSLKIELNDLPDDASTRALEICLEIERLFDSIEKSWKVFDHYIEFKSIPEITPEKTYDNLTPVQLLKAEKSKREAISKGKARIMIWTTQLKDVIPAQAGNLTSQQKERKLKLHRQLQKKNEDIMSHELALEKIKELINKK